MLSVLNSSANVFLVVKAMSDEEENTAYDKLSKASLTSPIARHRFLFYESSIGKLAIVRQLKPQLHIDYEIATCRQIAPHIRSVVHIRSGNRLDSAEAVSGTGGGAKHIHSIAKIEDLLQLSIH